MEDHLEEMIRTLEALGAVASAQGLPRLYPGLCYLCPGLLGVLHHICRLGDEEVHTHLLTTVHKARGLIRTRVPSPPGCGTSGKSLSLSFFPPLEGRETIIYLIGCPLH